VFENDRPGRRRRLWLAFGALVALLIGLLVLTQTVAYAPIDPITGTPQTSPVTYVWLNGVYGTHTTQVYGNQTVVGTTLLVGSVNATVPSGAEWQIPFPDALDLRGHATEMTLWFPAYLSSASRTNAMMLETENHTFAYIPTQPEDVPWFPSEIYVPPASASSTLPALFAPTQPYQYFAFHFSSPKLNTTIDVELQLPAHMQIYVPSVVFSVTGPFSEAYPASAVPLGLAILPFFLGAAVALLWVMVRLDLRRFLWPVAIGAALRLALAPLFMTTDMLSILRYPQIAFNFGFLDLQSWAYGLGQLFASLVAVSPLFAFGISPTLNSYNLLLKLPAIAFDLLAFLLIVRLLEPRWGARAATQVAVWGWLFNPLVVYFSAVHGLDESGVACLVLGALYLLDRKREIGAAASEAAAALLLYVSLLALPALAVLRSSRLRWIPLAVVLVAVPYLLVFQLLYGSLSPLGPYLLALASPINSGSPSFGTSHLSNMTPLALLPGWAGGYVTPIEGVAAAVVFAIVVRWRGRGLSTEATAVAVYGAFLAFYLTYPTFYVQLFVWAVPFFLVATLLVARSAPRALGLVLGVSCVGFATNYLSHWLPTVSPYFGAVFFTLAVLPAVILVLTRRPSVVPPARKLLALVLLAAVVISAADLAVVGPRALGEGLALLALGIGAGLSAVALLARALPRWLARARTRLLPFLLPALAMAALFLLPTPAPAVADTALLVATLAALVELGRCVARDLLPRTALPSGDPA
jgi:hypothetical protein